MHINLEKKRATVDCTCLYHQKTKKNEEDL
jgi:hypothetical protein